MTTQARTPGDTRRRIVEAAFQEFYLRGFQGGSVETILKGAGVTKGALYHHFRDKTALGYAVVDEVVREPILDVYLGPLEEEDGDPLATLQAVLRRRGGDFTDETVRLGCPLNNLAQEMSPLDDGFRERVTAALEAWTGGFEEALRRARERGFVRADVDTRRVAGFAVAAIEGAFGAAKSAGRVEVLRSNLETLADFLETLRPAAVDAPASAAREPGGQP